MSMNRLENIDSLNPLISYVKFNSCLNTNGENVKLIQKTNFQNTSEEIYLIE
jgi:hypothetical protein